MSLSAHRLPVQFPTNPTFGQRIRTQTPQGERMDQALGMTTLVGGGATLGSGVYDLLHGVPAPLNLLCGVINIWLGSNRLKNTSKSSLKDPD